MLGIVMMAYSCVSGKATSDSWQEFTSRAGQCRVYDDAEAKVGKDGSSD